MKRGFADTLSRARISRYAFRQLREGVRHGGLLPFHKIPQRLVDGLVERRRLIFGEPLLPDGIGALLSRFLAFCKPLLEGVVVRDEGAVERDLEVLLRMLAAEIVRAGADFADGGKPLPVL